jgi:iron complex transport system permease protein
VNFILGKNVFSLRPSSDKVSTATHADIFSTNMKITLDIDKLLEEGKIDVDDYETLRGYALSDTTSLALNILLGFGVVAVSGGMIALLASSVASMTIGICVGALGVYLTLYYSDRWNALSGISIVIGALMFGGGLIALTEGNAGGFLVLTAVYVVTGLAIRNSLLIALSPISLLGVLGAIGGYTHASYYMGIDRPALTILVFSLLAAGSHYASKRVDAETENVAIIFSRTCLFIVNFGFWIGSLWGDNLFAERDYRSTGIQAAIPDLLFVLAWAIGLVLLGWWAWRNNRRWVLNLVAVFGAIHFYTQWFERLGANPGSVVFGGIAAIGITLVLIHLNKREPLEPLN